MKDLTREQLLAKLPPEFHELDFDATYTLTKIGSKRPNIFVSEGDHIVGSLEVVQVPTTDKAGIKVQGHVPWAYMRTSPVLSVVDATENSLTFETEGGVYRLEKFGLVGPRGAAVNSLLHA